MKKGLALISAAVLSSLVCGCGSFFSNETGGNSGVQNTDGVTVIAVSPTTKVADSNATAYYTYGTFTGTGISTTGGSAVQAASQPNNGVRYFSPNSAPSSANPLSIGWNVPPDSVCPSSLNGTYGVYTTISYTAYGSFPPVNCQAAVAMALSQTSLKSTSWPSTLTLTSNYQFDTTYGTPQVAIYTDDGTLVGSETVQSVSADHTSVTLSTNVIPTPDNGGDPYDDGPIIRYALSAASINQDGSLNARGGSLFSTQYKGIPCTPQFCGK